MKFFLIVKKELFIILLSLLSAVLNSASPREQVVFLDVGVGDASLIQLEEMNILIDGGPDDEVVYDLSKYLLPVKPRIDILILSHFHSDHFNGLNELLNRYDIGEVWVPKMCNKNTIEVLGVDRSQVVEITGRKVITGGSGTLAVSLPGVGSSGCIKVGDENNGSLVVYLETPKRHIYFFGDIEKETELKMLESGTVKKAEIIKAAHHCSDTSSTKQFIQYVDPKLAICSTGEDNFYGHPSSSVLEVFEQLEIKVKITYEEGDVVIPLR